MVHQLQEKGIDLLYAVKWKVRNGFNIRFWDDQWCGHSPLKVLFPHVDALDGNKQCAVTQRLNCSYWSIEFRRMPRGCTEESQFTALLEAIRDVRLSDASDGWIWGLDHSGFSVASARFGCLMFGMFSDVSVKCMVVLGFEFAEAMLSTVILAS
ncbi:reverse transcriptase domain, Reverse transcriptase zinc-binding domain protein [Artemisia annua]|uniref:Reverse transcriptase domain, Reverse transcriptase zinc-binding domain protein n=1 Tax=Artemisia annua TaxID=35608 RepID=A0A2U1P0R8_ARTAN|nr:reverse transcriptase domain, Reverse transcriptase zinc-binding domain protein [Artemisia annua]